MEGRADKLKEKELTWKYGVTCLGGSSGRWAENGAVALTEGIRRGTDEVRELKIRYHFIFGSRERGVVLEL